MLRKLALAALTVAATGSAAMAADLYIPETPVAIVESQGVGFEGLYAGVQAGGYFEEDADTQGLIGGVVGYNFTASPLLLGVELQGNYFFENDDFAAAGELLALGKLGFVLNDNFAVYALGGIGHVWEDNDNDFTEYALGVGAELKVSDSMGVRADVLGISYDNDLDLSDNDGFDAARATVGLVWHF